MFAGHVGAAMAIGTAERRVNLGVFVCAALFLDLALWLFVLLGWESVTIPADFARTHHPEFVFPWSHGLPMALAWSSLAGAVAFLGYPQLGPARFRAAAWIGLAVFSHWLLDVLVHAPGLPIGGKGSAAVGLGLWQAMPAALAVESLITVIGLWLFVKGGGLPRGRMLGLAALVFLTLGATIAGMTVAPPPPSVEAMASSSLVAIVVACALAGWLGRRAA